HRDAAPAGCRGPTGRSSWVKYRRRIGLQYGLLSFQGAQQVAKALQLGGDQVPDAGIVVEYADKNVAPGVAVVGGQFGKLLEPGDFGVIGLTEFDDFIPVFCLRLGQHAPGNAFNNLVLLEQAGGRLQGSAWWGSRHKVRKHKYPAMKRVI